MAVPEVETSEAPEGTHSGLADDVGDVGDVGEEDSSGRDVVDYRTLIEQIPAITYT